MKKIASITLTALLLSACGQAPIQISSKDALEISLDSAGYKESEVTNIDIDEKDDYYVSFETNDNDFSFSISKNGIIKNRTIEKVEQDSNPEGEVSEEIVEEEAIEEKENNDQAAIDQTLSYLGLNTEDVQDTSVVDEEDGGKTVKFYVSKTGENITTSIDSNGQVIQAFTDKAY